MLGYIRSGDLWSTCMSVNAAVAVQRDYSLGVVESATLILTSNDQLHLHYTRLCPVCNDIQG
jgi:hypothetical protein